jgi:hypothetical protein
MGESLRIVMERRGGVRETEEKVTMATRAKMSDERARRRLENWRGILLPAPTQAEREARRILAETEPAHLSIYIPAIPPQESRYWSRCPHGLMGVETRYALADALRAFVAGE